MSIETRDIGAKVFPFNSIVPIAQASATARHGVSFDRYSASARGQAMPMSCQFHVEIGACGGTDIVKATLQDSADNATFADYVDPYTGVVASATLTGVSVPAMAFGKADLTNARRYIRLNTEAADQTIAAATVISGSIIFGGVYEYNTLTT